MRMVNAAFTSSTAASASQDPPRILVFIPAYNCAPQIPRVIAQFTPDIQALFACVAVVDNRSKDGTLDAAKDALAATLPVSKYLLIRNRENNGLGGSHKVAFNLAFDQGFTHLVVLHGDDQGSISDLVPLIRDGSYRDVDCLLGGRFMPGSTLPGYSRTRTVLNRVCNLGFSAITLQRVWDLGAGLNMYRVEAFRDRKYLNWSNSLSFNQVALLYSIAARQRLRFFPLTWREADQVSNVKLGRMGVQLARNVLFYLFRRNALLSQDDGAGARDYGWDLIAGEALSPRAEAAA